MSKTDRKQIEPISWEEFRNTGFLWFINRLLHTFGLSIVYKIDEGKVIDVYPARVKYRGFDEHNESLGFLRVTKYMRDHVDELVEDISDIEEERRGKSNGNDGK